MPNCTRIKPKPYKICTADFRYQITLNIRTKSATNTSAAEPNLAVASVITVWAMQKSVNGEEIFSDTNIIGKVTDEFYIRYNAAVNITTSGNITSNGAYYDIYEVIPDYQGRREISVIRCSKRGTTLLNVNKLSNT